MQTGVKTKQQGNLPLAGCTTSMVASFFQAAGARLISLSSCESELHRVRPRQDRHLGLLQFGTGPDPIGLNRHRRALHLWISSDWLGAIHLSARDLLELFCIFFGISTSVVGNCIL